MSNLANIIGLTQSTCECLNLSSEASFDTLNVSESGLYLTDHDGGFPMMEKVLASIDCNSPDNALDIMVQARADAIRQFPSDLSLTLAQRRTQATFFRGTIARPLIKSVFRLPAGATSVGLDMALPVRRGMSLVITKLRTGFPVFGDFTLNVWSNDPSFSAAPINVTGGADGELNVITLDTPLVLPQHSVVMASEGRILYRLYYTPPSEPYGFELHCCGQDANYKGQFAVHGFAVSDNSVTTVNDKMIGTYSTSPGLVLEGYQTCGVMDWLCETTELGGYDLRGIIARTIRYKAAINLIHRVLDSGNINAYTLLGREQMYGRRNHYAKEYANNVEWIAQNVPEGASDCLGCKKSIIEMATVPL